MCKTRDYFKEASFTDYKGNERKFTVAAIVEDFDKMDLWIFHYPERHCVNFGISIVHESDVNKYSPELSKTIAKGKALKEKTCVGIVETQEKFLTKKSIIDAYLDAYVLKMQQNPGKFIAGYDKQKEKFGK